MVFFRALQEGNFVLQINPYFLEYTYKNTARQHASTIQLNDFNLTVRSGNEETTIPYAHVTAVRLCKMSDDVFRMDVSYNNRILSVSNQFVADNGGIENRSRIYSTFVRVLHFHLKDKSNALYTSGCNLKKLWWYSVFATVASFAFCLVSDFLGFRVVNPYLDAMALSVIFITILYGIQLTKRPKDYSATNIPLTLLPSAH